jgi:hypothetical protein
MPNDTTLHSLDTSSRRTENSILLRGTFPQNNRGLFDRTHLRWFSLRDMNDAQTGFRVAATDGSGVSGRNRCATV